MMAEARSRKSRLFLSILLVLLLLLLCGLLWIFQSLSGSPDRKVVESAAPGVEFEFGAYTYANADGVQTDLKDPVGVAYDGDNRIYVTMPTQETVVVFDADGTNGRIFVQEDTTSPKEGGLSAFQVLHPLGIDVDENGDVYVACEPKSAVAVFSEDGTKLRDIPVMAPRYLHVYGGLLYVLSKGTLYIYDLNGTEIGRWGTYGRGPDQMAYPSGVTVTEDGTILIADTNNYRIIALSPDLVPVWVFGKPAATTAEQTARILASPVGIAVGEGGMTFVVDMLNHQIRVFDTEGAMIGDALGENGQLDNQFHNPSNIDHVVDDLLVVSDTGNNRVLGVRLNRVGEALVTPEISLESTASQTQ